jgi:hypothetical protein
MRKEWSKQSDEMLDSYCCPSCRDILTKEPDGDGYSCKNADCTLDFLPMPVYTMTDKINEFLKRYCAERKYCPVCGSEKYMSTLKSYAVDADNLDGYADMNECKCMNCGGRHAFHHRVNTMENKK